MAFRYDEYDKSIIIDGFQNGIADSPFDGISDLRNANIISVPGEASVQFATSKISAPTISGTIAVLSAAANVLTFTGTTGLENGMAVKFSNISGFGGALSGTTCYWLTSVAGTPPSTAQLYSDFKQSTGVTIGSTGTATMTVFNINQPKYFSFDNTNYWMLDASGNVWSSTKTTTSGYWTFTGNSVRNAGATATGNSISGHLVNDQSEGNGLVYYEASDGTGYLFAFSSSSIDYTKTAIGAFGWVYGWNPSDASTGNSSAYLKVSAGEITNYSHDAFVAPDSRVYYCDKNYIGRWYQTDPTVAFVPTTQATYTFDTTGLLPTTDVANCIAFLGTNILIGGNKNVLYPWDRYSTNFSYPILIAESKISKMVTVNTNTFVFAGNRGRIYITNGSQAKLYKKIPDHISGTIEPYYTWGGATSAKNQLYFSALVTTNAGVAINQYGGVWAIDLDTNAIRMTNKLSYNTYAGFASAIMPITTGNPAGTGLYIGWYDSSAYGIDSTISTPYTGGQTTVDSDLIPIGTFDKPRNFTRVEYRLTKPLVSGESISIGQRLDFSGTYTTILTDNTAGHFSNSESVNFANAQWLQLQAILTSTGTTPSYVRLKEMRINGVSQ